MARNYSSIAEVKTLADNVPTSGTNSDKVTVLPNTTGLPTVPFVLVLNPDTSNEEVVLATSLSGSTYTVTRNIEGGGVKSHTAGQTVKHMIVGSDLQIVHDHFSNNSLTTGTAHGVSGGVVGRTSSQTLTNKAISLADNTLTGTTAQFNDALSDANFATTALLEARIPVGAVNMWVTGTAPSGWLVCDGSEKAVADYSALATVLSTTYGALTNGSGGAGTTHFRLPDLRGRVPMGAGTGRNVADNANLTARTLGTKVSDAETVALTVSEMPSHAHPNDAGDGAGAVNKTSYMDRNASHGHGVSDPGHSHWVGAKISNSELAGYGLSVTNQFKDRVLINGANNTIGTDAPGTGISINGTDINHRHDIAAQGGGVAHNNTQPSTVINFIIKF